MANLQNIEVDAGTDETLTLYARDPSNLPATLAGSMAVKWRVGRPPFDPTSDRAIIEKDGTITSESGGIYTVALDPGDTLGKSGNYVHMGLTEDSGEVDFINNALVAVDFINNAGEELNFYNDYAGDVHVVTVGRFAIRRSVSP